MKTQRMEDVEHQVLEEYALVHAVEKSGSKVTCEARVYGRVEIDGKEYGFERVIRFRAKRVKQ